MVQGNAPRSIEQDQSRRGTGAIEIEILFADRDGSALQSGVEVLPHALDVGKLILRSGVLPLRRVAVELGGSDEHQTAAAELRAQLGDNRTLRFAVSAPVRPEEKQYRRTAKLGQIYRLRAQVRSNLQRR